MIKIKNGWESQKTMSEKFPVNNFERIKGTSQFNDGLLKNYHE